MALLRGPRRRYERRLPKAEDVLLAIEVMDSSVEHDRRLKLTIYAKAGIRECWLVNLPDNSIEVYRDPAGAVYKSAQVVESGQSIAPLAAPDVPLSVDDLLGFPGDDSDGEIAEP